MHDWRNIDELRIADVGRSLDIIDRDRSYSNIQLSGIDVQHTLVEEKSMLEGRYYSLGGYEKLALTHPSGEILLGYDAQWRYHEPR